MKNPIRRLPVIEYLTKNSGFESNRTIIINQFSEFEQIGNQGSFSISQECN